MTHQHKGLPKKESGMINTIITKACCVWTREDKLETTFTPNTILKGWQNDTHYKVDWKIYFICIYQHTLLFIPAAQELIYKTYFRFWGDKKKNKNKTQIFINQYILCPLKISLYLLTGNVGMFLLNHFIELDYQCVFFCPFW